MDITSHPKEKQSSWKKIRFNDLRELRKFIGICGSELREMIHNWESVKDIVVSGKFASIGLYEKPDPRDHDRAAYLLDFFGLSDKSDRRFVTLSEVKSRKQFLQGR